MNETIWIQTYACGLWISTSIREEKATRHILDNRLKLAWERGVVLGQREPAYEVQDARAIVSSYLSFIITSLTDTVSSKHRVVLDKLQCKLFNCVHQLGMCNHLNMHAIHVNLAS